MSHPRENESAYFVQDRTNTAEMIRLEVQDKMIIEGLGGVLPDLADLTRLRRVLDVGCGTGGWLIELAHTHPTIEKLVGGDISSKMVEYAHLGLDQRVRFLIMDALCMLEFSPASFDLVNQRLGASRIRHWEWRKIFLEYQRVTRLGGTIRITEADIVKSNSTALTKLCHLTLEACLHSARFFDLRRDGITSKLVPLMTTHGLQDIQTRDYTLIFQAGTSEHQSFVEDIRHFFRVALPFLDRWIRVPRDYDEIYQQALSEMQQPDFLATWQFRTVWGKRSSNLML